MTVGEQATHIDQADLVIWACGYQSNSLPIYDVGNSKKPLKYS